jgi:multidrug resistance efflux pump
MRRLSPTALLLAAFLSLPAAAQEQSVEDKLRDVLRQTIVQLRALQDSQGQLQADRDSAVKQRDQLQQQVADLQAKLAQAPAAKPTPPPDQEELHRAQAALAAARREVAALQASNVKWQAAYRQAAALAQQRDADAKRLAAGLQAARKVNDADHETNGKLASLAADILHLYRNHDFRNLLFESYEPLLGLKQVQLENLVQDYEDRIYGLRLFTQKAAAGQ